MWTRTMLITLTVVLLGLPTVTSGQVVPHVLLPSSLIVNSPPSTVVLQSSVAVMVQPWTAAGRQRVDVPSGWQITRRQGASSRNSSPAPVETRPRLLAEARVGFGFSHRVSPTPVNPAANRLARGPASPLTSIGRGNTTYSADPLGGEGIQISFGPHLRAGMPLGDIARQLRTSVSRPARQN